jgi:hypothetical protein
MPHSSIEMMCLPWPVLVLPHSRNLRTLAVTINSGIHLPPVANLAHLILECRIADENTFATLQQLRQLQTLQLSSASDSHVMAWPLEASLDLSVLHHLANVSFGNVRPAGLRLPSGCLVHFEGRPELL